MTISEPLKICMITNARSEYGILRWVMHDLREHSDFDLQLVASGPHMMKSMGETYRQIEEDGFTITRKVPLSTADTSSLGWSKIVGEMTVGLAEAFDALKPDMLLFMGDRKELLSIVMAGLLLNIPMGHISGGEITEGATDDQIRHAATKMSHLHFVANDVYGDRVRQMGEEDWRICISGEPGLDNFNRLRLMEKTELSESVGLNLSKPTALVTYHSVTQELDSLDDQIAALTAAMDAHDLQYLITYPGADTGCEKIIATWEAFVKNRDDRVLVKNLGQQRYISALRDCCMMIGNSSSGVVEAAVPNIPVVNIGNRQAGRMRATNVIDVGYGENGIAECIAQARQYDRSKPCKSLYGDGHSSGRILEYLIKTFRDRTRSEILQKKFVDRPL